MTGPVAPVTAVPVRHPGRWVAAAAVLVVLAQVVHGLATNKRFLWGVYRQYLFTSPVIHGALVTLELTVLAMLIGVTLGVLLAVMRLSANPLVAGAGWLYVYVFRGTPLFVQILAWNFIGALYPHLSVGIPFGPELVGGSANALVSQFTAGLLALGLNEAAYMSEIARAGILSVDEGQTEAAAALGMRRGLILRRIVLPQAMRVVIPPTGNETISMLKTSSLVSVIGVAELLFAVQAVYARTYETIPLLMVAMTWYLALTSVLSIGQFYLERRFARGASRSLPATPIQRLRRLVSGARP
ncbi:MAG: amino acid ABC transporter permease [Actinomycetota bacterium]|nr:amino acid ABC transporter permease [Actinomycetota bacterium]